MHKAGLKPSALKYAVILNGCNLKKTQMGENGVQGVGGSNPLVPTNYLEIFGDLYRPPFLCLHGG